MGNKQDLIGDAVYTRQPPTGDAAQNQRLLDDETAKRQGTCPGREISKGDNF